MNSYLVQKLAISYNANIFLKYAFSPLPIFLTYFLLVNVNRQSNDASMGARSDGQSLSGHSYLTPIKQNENVSMGEREKHPL